MSKPHPESKTTRTCADCPATIPAYGNRKRCLECQDRAYRARKNNRRKKGKSP